KVVIELPRVLREEPYPPRLPLRHASLRCRAAGGCRCGNPRKGWLEWPDRLPATSVRFGTSGDEYGCCSPQRSACRNTASHPRQGRRQPCTPTERPWSKDSGRATPRRSEEARQSMSGRRFSFGSHSVAAPAVVRDSQRRSVATGRWAQMPPTSLLRYSILIVHRSTTLPTHPSARYL